MGNQTSDGRDVDEHSQLMENYITIKTIQDDRYGEGVLMQNKITGAQSLLKEYNSTDDIEFEKTYAKYKKRQELNHENIVQLIGLAQKKESQLCSTFYKVYVLYEFVNDNLEKRIQLRSQTRKNFSEGELWDFLVQSVSGLYYLQSKGLSHQNVKASNLFFDQSERIKVADSQVIQQLNMFSQVATNPKEPPKNVYLSPALMEALSQNNWNPNHESGKSDVFSLGMTILSAGLLEDLDCCYQYYPEPLFLDDIFKQRFNQFKSIYSGKLTNLIGLMTSMNEEIRPDFTQLWNQLQQFNLNELHSVSVHQTASYRSQFEDVIVNQGQDGSTKLKALHQSNEDQQPYRYGGVDNVNTANQKKQSPSTQPKIIADDNENVVDDTEDVIDQIKRQNPQNYNKNYAEKQQQHNQFGLQNQVESRLPAAPQRSLSQHSAQNQLQVPNSTTIGQPTIQTQANPMKNSNYLQNQQTSLIQSSAIPKQNNPPLPIPQPNIQNYSNNSYSNLAPKPAAPTNTGIPRYPCNTMMKDTPSAQSFLINPPKTAYTCKTQPDENTGAIERGTTRQGEVENFLQSQHNNQAASQIQPDNHYQNQYLQLNNTMNNNNGGNQKLSSRSNSFYNNNTASNGNTLNANARSGSSANLLANTSAQNIQPQNRVNSSGSVHKQNSFHNSNPNSSMIKDQNVQNLNDISNIHNYSNIDDYKISNQQSNIFMNNPKLQQLTTTTPYRPQSQSIHDNSGNTNNKTKLDEFQNIKHISQPYNHSNNSFLENTNTLNQKDDYPKNPTITSNIPGANNPYSNLSQYLPPQQAKSIGMSSNNTSYNNMPGYSKPNDYSFPTNTQQYSQPYSQNQNDGKSLLTNFDELKLKLQEAEQKAKQEYESKYGQSATSSYNSSVQFTQGHTYQQPAESKIPYSKNLEKTNSEVDEIMKKYENKNTFSSSNNGNSNPYSLQNDVAGGDQSNRKNSLYKQTGDYSNIPSSTNNNNNNNYSMNINNNNVNNTYNPSPSSHNYSMQMQNEPEEQVKKSTADNLHYQHNVSNLGSKNITPIQQMKSEAPAFTPMTNVQSFLNQSSQAHQNYQFSPEIQQQHEQSQQQYAPQYSNSQQQQQQQQPYNAQDNLPSFNFQQQYNSDYNNNNINNSSNNNQYYSNGYNNEIPEVVIENYSNGSRYEGEKLNGMRHGQGRFYYQDGGIYDGEWRDNKMNGRGVLSYASGRIAYDGNWEDDKFHGFGALYNENPAELLECFDYRDFDQVDEFWIKYDGEFKDDNKDGFGTLYISNGERFEGSFKNDFVCGPGSFYKINGEKIDGIWQNNKLIQS